jgi:hypothetical protein
MLYQLLLDLAIVGSWDNEQYVVIKKGDVALVAQNDIRRSLFHNVTGSLPFVILIRM